MRTILVAVTLLAVGFGYVEHITHAMKVSRITGVSYWQIINR